MTKDQILELAESLGFDKQNYGSENCWLGYEEALLKFAREMYRKGKYYGYEKGYDDSQGELY